MEQQFLEIDPEKKEEQLYYPSIDFASNPEINSPQEDSHFVDQTLKAEKEGCCSEKIIRTDTNSFIHNNIFQKSAIYFFIGFGFFMGLVTAISGKFDSSYIIGALIFLILGFVFDHFGYFNENLILESNSIVCTKKSLFRKRKFFYYRRFRYVCIIL